MQKQPNTTYRIVAHSYTLPDGFPVELLGYYEQGDGDVTFLHFHNCMEIGYCYNGSGIFFVNDKVLPYKKGDACIIFKNQLHIARSMKGERSSWHFVYIDPEILLSGTGVRELALITSAARGSDKPDNILTSFEHPEIVWLIEKIAAELICETTAYTSAIRSMVWTLMVHIERMIPPGSYSGGEHDMQYMVKIAKALEYITINYMHPIKIKELASLCYISLTSLRRLFNACLGVSPLEYITKVRIQTAAALLNNTNDSILQISLRVGYTTLSSFNRHFVKITGMTPKEWRRGNNFSTS